MFRKERWPVYVITATFFLIEGGWFFLPPLLLGLAAIWPVRGRIPALFRAKQRWEKELAVLFSGFLAGVIVFLTPYLLLIKYYVAQK